MYCTNQLLYQHLGIQSDMANPVVFSRTLYHFWTLQHPQNHVCVLVIAMTTPTYYHCSSLLHTDMCLCTHNKLVITNKQLDSLLVNKVYTMVECE